MAENTNTAGPGGFFRQNLPSPAPSAVSTRSASGLPHPRAHPLRPGSVKEDKVRGFVEERLMHINRRYVKKFGLKEEGDEVTGYGSVSELCKDLEALVDVLWLSGTPSLQIPYLLNVANEFITWVTSFAPSPVATFSVLRKLDFCFASLLSGQDIETKETLPGFENGLRGGLTQTDKVRCKSIVEQTRVIIVEVMNKAPEEDMDTETDVETDAETGDETDATETSRRGFVDPNWDEEDEGVHMDVARVYERTLVQLGEVMGGSGLDSAMMSAN